jgi:hypothetical protein
MPSRFYRNVVSRPALSSQVIELPKPTTVVADPKTTVVDEHLQTVVDEPTTAVVAGNSLWKAELNGALFPASRVKPIERAQDALTHAEECVYDFLWGTKNTARDDYRIAQAGYDRIAKAARVTKRNAALIVDRLIEKGFVWLETEADPLHRVARQYRVLSYRAVLDELARSGRQFVVRSGNGVLFVRAATVAVDPLSNPTTTVVADQPTTVVADQPTTVVADQPTTIVADQPTTVVATTTVTVVVDPTTTVVATTTLLDNKKEQAERQSSSSLADVCRKNGILLDDAAERIIQKRCRTYDPIASNEEIAYFAEAKIDQLRQSRNIGNPVGLLMTAVPEYFVEPAHEVQRYRASKAQNLAQGRETARKILDDPESGEQEREWAKSVLGDT